MVRQFEVNTAWTRLKRLINGWRIGLLPGLTLTGLVMALRMLGVFQTVEWKTLDLLLRWRPAEPTDERILIVGINEADIQRLGTYPVPDETLAALLKQLDQHEPRAVGIDIFRDLPVEPGHQTFVSTLADLPYVFGIEFLDAEIAPTSSLPEERVGFSDFLLDADGRVRRSLLGSLDTSGEYHFSLAIRLAEAYLSDEQISLENGIKHPSAMRFNTVELPPFESNTGGYVGADENSQQTLLHFRGGPSPFHVVSLNDVMTGNVTPEWIQDSVILIGMTSPTHKDIVQSGALSNREPGGTYGVEIHAHAVSQILSAVMDERPLLQSMPALGEYIWIFLWGAAGITLVGLVATPSRYLCLVLATGVGLVGGSYVALLAGWWLPLGPTLIAFLLNGLVLPGILLYDQMLRARIEESQRVIEHTYTVMHSGPLQTLALLLRDVDDVEKETNDDQVSPRLHKLDQEIRSLYETLEKELESDNHQIHLEQGAVLDLDTPLHVLLHQVYTQTLKRDFPNFQSIQVRIVTFEPMQTQQLSIKAKNDLCRFLEESLCNVGKHAENVTRLKIKCLSTDRENLILVEDNGKNLDRNKGSILAIAKRGRGTRQAQKLSKQLNGQFKRTAVSPHGVCCELKWHIR